MNKPCHECPFSKDSRLEPGVGVSDPLVFVGQARGPFLIHCHADGRYRGKGVEPAGGCEECAGAAVFRANCGWAESLPPELLRLPADRDGVFLGPAEFVGHHAGIRPGVAAAVLVVRPPELLCLLEIRKVQSGAGYVRRVSRGQAQANPEAQDDR